MIIATAVNELGANPYFPWVMGAVSAAFFAYIAHRLNRARAFWAVNGGLFAFVLITVAMGLAHATAVPYTAAKMQQNFIYAAALSASTVIGLGLALLFLIKPAPAMVVAEPAEPAEPAK